MVFLIYGLRPSRLVFVYQVLLHSAQPRYPPFWFTRLNVCMYYVEAAIFRTVSADGNLPSKFCQLGRDLHCCPNVKHQITLQVPPPSVDYNALVLRNKSTY